MLIYLCVYVNQCYYLCADLSRVDLCVHVTNVIISVLIYPELICVCMLINVQVFVNDLDSQR